MVLGDLFPETQEKDFGENAIGNISKMLKEELSRLKGFSEDNIKLMRRFYETWEDLEPNSVVGTTELNNRALNGKENNSAVATAELQNTDNQVDSIQLLQLTGYEDFPIMAFLNVSFTHHVAIIRKTETLDERKYHI